MSLDRRRFVHCSLCATAGSWLLQACGESMAVPDEGPVDAGGSPDRGAGSACDDAFRGGTLIRTVPFVGTRDTRFHTKLGRGWDGRLYTDLSALTDGSLLVDNERFYLRTFDPDGIDPDLDRVRDWTVRVTGMVEEETTLRMADLEPLVRDQGAHVLECSGNFREAGFGLLSAGTWAGAPMSDVLDSVRPLPGATRVMVSGFDEHSVPSVGGHSTPGAEWIFTFDQLRETGAFLATRMNGELLPPDHGAPLRLYVPGWYGCTCIKWVNELRFVDEDEPSTGQMREFASRTHQLGVPTLARDFRPASMDQSAMPVRVEQWEVDGAPLYRVIGVLWGGSRPVQDLIFEAEGDVLTEEPVEVCPPMTQNQLWTLWQHAWRPTSTGTWDLYNRVDDPDVRTFRLDRGWYGRSVVIDAV